MPAPSRGGSSAAAEATTLQQYKVMNWRDGPRNVINLAPSITDRPFAIATGDDGYEDLYTYTERADLYGVKMTLFLNSPRIDKLQAEAPFPYITSEQVRDAYDNGHEIANHTTGHIDMRTLTYDEVIADLIRVNTDLERIIGGDYRCLTGAWPMNLHGAVCRAAAEQLHCGWRGGFTSADWETEDEMSPLGAHCPHLFAAYMVPKITTFDNITNSTADDEATIRATVRTNLQTAVNAAGHFIIGGHNRNEATFDQFEYICDEMASDGRFRMGTFAECVQWTRERVPRGNVNQWIASYNRRYFWKSVAQTTFTYVYPTSGGPHDEPYLRITNTTGAEAVYTFFHDTYAGEEMTFSAYVRGYSGGGNALVSNAVQLRVAGTDDANHDAPATWTRISHTRTPGALDDTTTGFALQAGVTIEIALPQLQVGAMTPWVDPYPDATTT